MSTASDPHRKSLIEDADRTTRARLLEAFSLLTGPERQMLFCALEGVQPDQSDDLRTPLVKALELAGISHHESERASEQ
jgi:hypothetical protein